MSLNIGQIFGDYEVLEVLGSGGMGKVYKVRNTVSGRIEAIKVLLKNAIQAWITLVRRYCRCH